VKHRKLKNKELQRKSVDEARQASKTPLILILDNIRSLNNIGSVFRSSDAFLIQKIYLCGITAQPPHKDIHKTALGSTDSVAWEYVENTLELVEKLKQDEVEVWSIEQAEKSIFLNDFQPKKNQVHAFVLGNEIKGVDQEVVNASQGVIEIPQEGAKHSLNIAVTAGVVAWDYFQKINQA
tara:strand:- start:236 stop:775 length:540 start_codon:yes stop_codon:yes gene_type:complete